MTNVLRIIVLLLSILYMNASATVINIPADYPTIQQGIDASSNGDTVLVQPGTYFENINFNGHNITLGSLFLTTGDRSYIETTIIDGDSSGSVVTFQNYEDSTALFSGFTITRGNMQEGGGISCTESNPVITNNIITLNLAYNYGAGIFCYYANPVISHNDIHDNNVLLEFGRGGGIYCGSSEPLINNNVIHHNTSAGMGGGVSCAAGDPVFINNVICGNTAGGGGGIYGWVANPVITNCILWGNMPTQIHMAGGSVPEVSYCDIDSYWPGTGNIRAYPNFRDPADNDFHLMSIPCGDSADSPCIDVGDPTIQDSLLDCDWGLGSQLSDMGAYGGGDSTLQAIEEDPIITAIEFAILRNYPNPFNSSTNLEFRLSSGALIEISVYNLLGQKTADLYNGFLSPGEHNISWDATGFPSGIYFARLKSGGRSVTQKMVFLK